MSLYAAITGWGMAVPERVVTNDDLAQLIDTSDEWIRTRTGIRERHIAGTDEYTSVLATRAARQALERSEVDPEEIELVILATSTPDLLLPATACVVQANLNIPRAGAFDLAAACSGFIYGLHVATGLIRSGIYRNVLLIAADLMTRLLNWEDRNTCVLFGDGAGAVVLQASPEPAGALKTTLRAGGENEKMMFVGAGGTRLPLTDELYADRQHKFVMNGREVFRFAVREMVALAQEVVADAGLTMDDIGMLLPHQANIRILEAVSERLPLPPERVYTNVQRYGNTSAASVPLALAEAADEGFLHPGDNLLLAAAGAGLTWGASVVRWTAEPH